MTKPIEKLQRQPLVHHPSDVLDLLVSTTPPAAMDRIRRQPERANRRLSEAQQSAVHPPDNALQPAFISLGTPYGSSHRPVGISQNHQPHDRQPHADCQPRGKPLAKYQHAHHRGQRRLNRIQGIDVNHARELQRLGQRNEGDRVAESSCQHQSQLLGRCRQHATLADSQPGNQAQAYHSGQRHGKQRRRQRAPRE